MPVKSCRDVTVLEMRPVGQSETTPGAHGSLFELRLELPDWNGWRPGQFVMVRPRDWGQELTWGRPFSICRGGEGWFSVFVQVVGRGTQRLSRLKQGERVTVWGPLGNSFAVEPETPTLMLAGGVGVAPFVGYAAAHPNPERLELLFACRQSPECYPLELFDKRVKITTVREASPADLPMVIAAVRGKVEEYAAGLALCCGPTPFMRTVRERALELGARAQLSLENRMACGVGACLGCVCKTKNGENVQTCTRGPVFWAADVEL
jgi:dihydroorotate dehydrogenase electron transfer subunit